MKYLLNENVWINNITNNINLILKFLASDNIKENKWILRAIRKFFQNTNIPYGEYLILFENNFHKYFDNLLNKYMNNYIIINEIFFIICNFYNSDDVVNQYPKKYIDFF